MEPEGGMGMKRKEQRINQGERLMELMLETWDAASQNQRDEIEAFLYRLVSGPGSTVPVSISRLRRHDKAPGHEPAAADGQGLDG